MTVRGHFLYIVCSFPARNTVRTSSLKAQGLVGLDEKHSGDRCETLRASLR